MSDAGQNSTETNVEEQEKPTVDYAARVAELEKALEEYAPLKKKNEQLLAEKKKHQEKETQAQKEAYEQSKKNGEYEKLWQQEQKEKEELAKALQSLKTGYRQEKLDVTAMRIATELADGDNAELLSSFVKSTLDSLADESGSLGDDVLRSVVNEYKENQKYRALLRGSKASGGGAPGNLRGAADTVTISRAEFANMPASKQAEMMAKVRKGSATLTD